MTSTVLVTGATGYVGGQLVASLVRDGVAVRVITRSRDRLNPAWRDQVKVLEGDLGDESVLRSALDGVDTAYYLVHSMASGSDFATKDRSLAQRFAEVAGELGVGRIIYLSGLHPADEELSPHLASRVEVGEIFLDGPAPAAVLQAAVVLGLGSASFDMLRYLTTRLPAMVAPRWLQNRIQPIAVDDAVHYLSAARELAPEVNRTFDIGGPDVLTYEEMMQRFAAVTGLRRRLVVTVPVLTPRLASQWIGLVTPVDVDVAKPLVDSLIHEVVMKENDLADMVGGPPGGATGFDDAVRRAMQDAAPDTFTRDAGRVAAGVGLGAGLSLLGLGVRAGQRRRRS